MIITIIIVIVHYNGPMYRKFNTARASVVRPRNKSRSPSRFISARRASFVRAHRAPAPPPTRASGRGPAPGCGRPPCLPAHRNKSRQRLWQTSRYYVVVVVFSALSFLPRTLPSACACAYVCAASNACIACECVIQPLQYTVL